jgi:hypothetical protein
MMPTTIATTPAMADCSDNLRIGLAEFAKRVLVRPVIA